MRPLAALCVIAAACSSSSTTSSCPAGFECSNTINQIVLPMLAKDHVTPKLASDAELCRRYAIDLTGRAPLWSDYQQHCQGKSPSEMVDFFLAQPGYVKVNQRLWADAFSYDNRVSWYSYIVDLDAQVAKLYSGQLGYADFAAIAVAHPAFVGEFAGENVVAYAYQAFLGRDALPEERADLLALYRMWRTRQSYDPMIGAFKYNACKADTDCATGRTCQSGVCTSTTNYKELYIDPRMCAGALGQLDCTSAMHGVSVVLDGAQPLTLDQLTPDQWNVLRAPGRVLAAEPYFWEAAVDRVLTKYLGWWHAGIELPGYELPEVRQALANDLKASNGDLRALEREVLTSALYTMAADHADDPKFWHYGPTKQMLAEAWLDSVGGFAGVDLGRCDWRFDNTTARWLPMSLLPPKAGLSGFDYTHEARILGGCPDQGTQQRITDVGVLYAMEQRNILSTVCGATTRILGAPDAKTLVGNLYRDALTWDAPAAELAAITPPGADDGSARQLCQAVLRSGRFLFY